jgi:hypothetical protein
VIIARSSSSKVNIINSSSSNSARAVSMDSSSFLSGIARGRPVKDADKGKGKGTKEIAKALLLLARGSSL